MPPVPVHIDDPIAPKKADGVTPQTADTTAQASPNAATTQDQSSSYPPARPGAAAVPAPTPYVPNLQPQPTATRTSFENNGPPPPQPGAVPVPPGHQATVTAASTLPPPPKAGESAQRQGGVTTMPPQMGIPPPQQGYAPTHSTLYSPPESQGTGPTTLNFGAAPAPQIQAGSHPPGYQQNVMAQEMSSAARASLDAQERRDGFVATGLLGGDSSNDLGGGSMWDTMKGWANTAGKTLAETEKEVWKRINKG